MDVSRAIVSETTQHLRQSQMEYAISELTQQIQLLSESVSGLNAINGSIGLPDRVRSLLFRGTLVLQPVLDWKVSEHELTGWQKSFYRNTVRLLAYLEETGWQGDSKDRWDPRTHRAMVALCNFLRTDPTVRH